MLQLDTESIDGSVAGDVGKKRQYSYVKCTPCREQKKKVLTELHRTWADFSLTCWLLLSVRAGRPQMARQMQTLH